jgi:hypothetical protein
MQQLHDWIIPQWTAPANIRAVTTSRIGGHSQSEYSSMNLGDRTEDNMISIARNRNELYKVLDLPCEPTWLYQSHSTKVVRLYEDTKFNQDADASYTTVDNKICVVLTADCLPLLFCAKDGSAVSAVHAGWRGLANGIIETTISTLLHFGKCRPENLLVWLGPAIGPGLFEVGEDVRATFIEHSVKAKKAFTRLPSLDKTADKKWLADLYMLARQRLDDMGVSDIFGGGFCTATQYEKFYSYRRDGNTGRMASLIWMTE